MSHAKKESTLDRLLKQLQRIERSKPTDYETGKAELLKANELFHQFVAERFEPLLNRYAATLPQESLDERKTMARHLNAEMRALGVALKTDTGEPAILCATTGKGQPKGRILTVLATPERRVVKAAATLPVLELIGRPHALAERSAEPWTQRVHKGSPRSRE